MEGHVRTVAILHIVLSIMGFFLSIVIYLVLNLILGFTDVNELRIIFSIVANIVAGFLFVISIPGLIGGIGLYKFKEWARILILIVSALKLLNFPVGTAVGIYSIWALVQKDSIALCDTATVKNTNL
mgnify:CR=1 FL=1